MMSDIDWLKRERERGRGGEKEERRRDDG